MNQFEIQVVKLLVRTTLHLRRYSNRKDAFQKRETSRKLISLDVINAFQIE